MYILFFHTNIEFDCIIYLQLYTCKYYYDVDKLFALYSDFAHHKFVIIIHVCTNFIFVVQKSVQIIVKSHHQGLSV